MVSSVGGKFLVNTQIKRENSSQNVDVPESTPIDVQVKLQTTRDDDANRDPLTSKSAPKLDQALENSNSVKRILINEPNLTNVIQARINIPYVIELLRID